MFLELKKPHNLKTPIEAIPEAIAAKAEEEATTEVIPTPTVAG